MANIERSKDKSLSRDDLHRWWDDSKNKPVHGVPSLGSIRKQWRKEKILRKPEDLTWHKWGGVKEAAVVKDFIGHEKRVRLIRETIVYLNGELEEVEPEI